MVLHGSLRTPSECSRALITTEKIEVEVKKAVDLGAEMMR
jgi:hypothetical protein